MLNNPVQFSAVSIVLAINGVFFVVVFLNKDDCTVHTFNYTHL